MATGHTAGERDLMIAAIAPVLEGDAARALAHVEEMATTLRQLQAANPEDA